MDQLSNLALKNAWEKERFFDMYLSELLSCGKIPKSVQIHLILPQLTEEISNPVTPSHLLPKLINMFLIMVSLIETSVHFDRVGKQTWINLMKSPERAIRYLLLANLPSYQQYIDSATTQQLFEFICAGLSDSSAELRDVTLRSMVIFIPKVADRNALVERASKLIAKCLQHDEIPKIRTNAVICFAKLANVMDSTFAIKNAAPPLLFGLRDTFAPCRLASLKGLAQIGPVLSVSDVAMKCLPNICPRLVDEDPEVRKKLRSTQNWTQCRSIAFSLVSRFLEKTVRPTIVSENNDDNLLSHEVEWGTVNFDGCQPTGLFEKSEATGQSEVLSKPLPIYIRSSPALSTQASIRNEHTMGESDPGCVRSQILASTHSSQKVIPPRNPANDYINESQRDVMEDDNWQLAVKHLEGNDHRQNDNAFDHRQNGNVSVVSSAKASTRNFSVATRPQGVGKCTVVGKSSGEPAITAGSTEKDKFWEAVVSNHTDPAKRMKIRNPGRKTIADKID